MQAHSLQVAAEFVDVYGRTCMGWATTEALPVLEKARDWVNETGRDASSSCVG